MSWTQIAKPTTDNWSIAGSQAGSALTYDDASTTYDSALTYYDGSAQDWSQTTKPVADNWILIAKPT